MAANIFGDVEKAVGDAFSLMGEKVQSGTFILQTSSGRSGGFNRRRSTSSERLEFVCPQILMNPSSVENVDGKLVYLDTADAWARHSVLDRVTERNNSAMSLLDNLSTNLLLSIEDMKTYSITKIISIPLVNPTIYKFILKGTE